MTGGTILNSTAMEHFHRHRKVFLWTGLARAFNRLGLKFVLFIEKELGLSEKKKNEGASELLALVPL